MARFSKRQFRNDLDLVYDIYDEYRTTRDWWQPWRERAIESFQYWRGIQWKAEDARHLNDKHRPILAFNQILNQINVVVGNQKLNRFDTIAKPRGVEDQPYIEIVNALLKHFKDDSNYHFIESKAFLYCVLCGVGYLTTGVDTSVNPEGEVIQGWENPLYIYPDENSVKEDYTDEEKTFKSLFLGKNKLIELYPEKEGLINKKITFAADNEHEIDDSSENDLLVDERRDGDFIDTVSKTVRVIEKKWWKLIQVQKVVNNQTGDVFDVDKNMSDTEIAQLMQNRPELTVHRGKARERWVTTIAQSILLENKAMQHQNGQSDITPVWCYKLNRDFFGMVDNWKDYQDEVNKRRSSILDSIVKQGKGGWIISKKADKSQFTKNLDIITVNGKPSEQAMPKPLPQIPAALVQYEQYILNDWRSQGVNQASLGIQESANEPFKLHESKLRQSNIQQSTPHDNLRLATKLHQKKVLMLAQMVYTQPRVLRYIGESYKESFFEINTSEWNDISKVRFDMHVDEGRSSVSNREYELALMVNLFEMMVNGGYPAQGIPWDIAVKMADISKRDEIANHIKNFMMIQGLSGGGSAGGGMPGGSSGGGGAPQLPAPQQAAAAGPVAA